MAILQPGEIDAAAHGEGGRQIMSPVHFHQLEMAVAEIALELGAGIAGEPHGAEDGASRREHLRHEAALDHARRAHGPRPSPARSARPAPPACAPETFSYGTAPRTGSRVTA